MSRRYHGAILAGTVALCLCATFVAAQTADAILRETGVQGGIVVHLGCGDGTLTAALRADERYTVHGLAADAQRVMAAQAHVQAQGLYGPVSIEQLRGNRLPYAENLVDLVVVEDAGGVPMGEVMRVLRPGGVAYVKEAAGWRKTVKPVPPNIDEWPHFLHDAGNNAVANDSVVGPPRRLQWLAGPLFLRSHETASGFQSQVAAGGRVFYVFDEGLIGITDERLPGRWSIVCRNAFNGKLLWKRPMPEWGWRQWGRERFKGKDWTKLRAARVSAPVEVQRRLVADADRLYATLGYRGPLAILDATTGKVLKAVDETAPALEVLLSDGIVVAHVRQTASEADKRRGKGAAGQSALVAVKADTGDVLWRTPTGGTARSVFVAGDGGRVFAAPGGELACFDLKTGKPLWRSKLKSGGGRTMVASAGAVVILGGTTLDCYDAESGELRWNRKTPARSGYEAVDLFVVDGLVWPGMVPVNADLKPTNKSEQAVGIGYDIQTGEEKKRILVKKFRSPEHHHRCYRNKATSRYIISGMEGAEFLDLQGDGHSQNNFVRGACKLGIMPCYGMLYVPPDQCFCQPGAKLLGYAAIGPAAASPVPDVPDAARLEKGPAYGKVEAGRPANPADWATYRHDPARHGSTPAVVPAKVATDWRVRIGGRLAQPVAANGRVFVTAIDAHTVHALDAATGKEAWRFVAGGRVDSPPTVHDGLVLFGSLDGRVTCLRESDGVLVWRLLAAPHDRRIACFDQLESVWPVHGSVLIRDGVAYVAAGRSTYLDGGIRFYGIDPRTGRVLHKGLLEGPQPTVGEQRDVAFYIRGANSDVLVSEGDAIYMRQKKLTPQLKEVGPAILSSKGEADVGLHMFSTSSLLDGSWYNRTFWMYSKRWPGFQLANQAPKTGQLIVADDATTYALKVFYRRNVHSPMFFPGKEGYLLFADKNTTEPQIVGEQGARPPLRWLPQSDYSRGGNRTAKFDSKAFGLDKMMGYTRADPPLWTLWLPVRVRAMVKTRDVLFAAGPPDVYDPEAPYEAFEGKRGAALVAVSSTEGKKLSEMKLDAPPVFDGLIAVEGRLFVALTDGSILSLK
jgi:outer membrane protein assembly factor BamB